MERTGNSGLFALALALTVVASLFWSGWGRSAIRAAVKHKAEALADIDVQAHTNASRQGEAFHRPIDPQVGVAMITAAADTREVQIASLSVLRQSILDLDSAEFAIEVDATGGYVSVKTWLADVLARSNQIGVRRMSISRAGPAAAVNVHVTFALAGVI